MKSTRFWRFCLMMSCVLFVCGNNASAQEASNGIIAELTRQLVQAIPKELVQDIKRQLIQEMRKELASEARNEPNYPQKPIEMSDLLQTLGQHQRAGADSSETIQKLAAAAKHYLNASERLPQREPVPSNFTRNPNAERIARGDFIAVVTNQTNPVRSLTMDQIRGLFSGQYTNWKDVGGPDMEVRVLTWDQTTATLENLLQISVTPAAMRARYASLMIPLVDRTQGAIGFLPTQNSEQADFLLRHDALKKIAIQKDMQSPAVMPSRLSLADGTYPMVAVPAVAWSTPAASGPGQSLMTLSISR
jgi:hypothetical protein